MVDRFILAGMIREAALWGWVMGGVIFGVTLAGILIDEIVLERIGVGRLGLAFWHYFGLATSPVMAWWLIVYQRLDPVI